MNPQFIAKTAITVALVLAASMLSKRPGLLGALVAALPLTSLLVLGWLYAETRDAQRVAAMSMDIFWFVIGGLLFFPVLSFSLKAGWQPWLCFLLAGLAGFAGMSGAQYLLAYWRPR
jgi:phosphatidylglycerophosphate synthase